MRNDRVIGALPALLVLALVVSGCSRDMMHDAAYGGRLSIKDTAPSVRAHRRPVRAASRPRRTQSRDNTGASLRRFCGTRHLRFQARTLMETPAQMARNNALCRKIYTPRKGA